MLIVLYDISSTPKRTRFSNFLKKYGRRFQYSAFQIKNSKRVLNNIMAEIESNYEPFFTEEDSIVIIPICKGCDAKISRYGYAKNEESEILIV